MKTKFRFKMNPFKQLLYFVAIIICAFMLLSAKCSFVMDPDEPKYYDDISIVNNSDESIFAFYFASSSPTHIISLEYFSVTDFYDIIEIKPGQTKLVCSNFHPEETWHSNELWQFLIFKQTTFQNYSYEEIIENNIYDKRIIISYDDLKANDFKIVYTGD